MSSQVSAHLVGKHLTPTTTWLAEFISSQRPTTPVPALKQTALFRLLTSDITKTLNKSRESVFPADILNGELKERRLAGPIPVQMIGIEDVGQSKWNQIEAIEAAERGETTKGREIVRVVPGDEDLSNPTTSKGGPHKLLVQDACGARVYAFEVADVEGISTSMSIGVKMVLTDILVARGVLLLKPGSASLLGGKIESLDKAWKESQKAELKSAVETVQT
ncbi:MAG: hypothetical protein M1828_004782 [Chrysothrix sp. TS-e1954]|nr:MAG: hypothetical protein M1828_004782 [Chrysothrix sp. TS-e1954]